MTIKDKVLMCFSNLYKRKVRTVLTTMGVVVGTCAIVITVSLGIGMQKSQEEALAQMGDLTIITIQGYGISPDQQQLDDKVLETIRSYDHVVALTPAYMPSEWGAVYLESGKFRYDGMIYGVYLNDLEALGYTFMEGEFPAEGFRENTVLFGSSAVYDFYNTKKNSNNRVFEGSGKDPLVDVMEDKINFVIRTPDDYKKRKPEFEAECYGILAEDWNKRPSPSWSVFMDINYLKKLEAQYNKINKIKVNKDAVTSYETVSVKVDDMNNVAEVEEKIQELGFQTYSMESVRKPMQEKARKDQMMLGSLGAISLLVAAIGITNTMIMSIYERTREIGVMKVLGCVISDIRSVFLMEAASIGFLGGIFGVIISYFASFLINHFGATGGSEDIFMMLQGGGATTSIIPLWLVISAIIFSTLIGLLSGIYPANRAVNISALAAIKQD